MSRSTSAPAVPAFLLVPLGLLAGLLGAGAFAPLWFLPGAFLGAALLVWLVGRCASWRAVLGLAVVYGVSFNAVALVWQVKVQWSSYLGLVLSQTAFAVLLVWGLWRVRRLPAAPVAMAAWWVLVEALQARFPFGGFSWTRLGYAMVDTPLSSLYPWVGAAGVSFVVALIACTAASLALNAGRPPWRLGVGVLVGVVIVTAGALVVRTPLAPLDQGVAVGWVQGGADGTGFYGIGAAGETGKRHARETTALLGRVAAGELPAPSFIVWPENGLDDDPLRSPVANKVIADAVAQAGVPILVTAPTVGPRAGERQTTALWWTNAGVQGRYEKRNLVPFGEWIPFREVLLPMLPILSAVGDQAIPGDRPGVLTVTDGQGQPRRVGVAICYEVAFADTLADAVRNGADVMIVGSNNAMFQHTSQIDQQFAITRVRAAELGRQILVVTTSGVSGLIDERGGVRLKVSDPGAASGVAQLEPTARLSPWVQGGWLVEFLLAAVGLGSVAVGLIRRPGAGRQGLATTTTNGG